MKAQRFLLIILAAAALTTVSCTKKYYEETIVQGTQMTIRDFDIHKANWSVNEEGGYFSADLQIPEITRTVLSEGTIQVLRKLTDGNGQVSWTPLPVVRANSDTVDGEEYLYSTYLDYEWTVGHVYIYYTCTDFFTDEFPESEWDVSIRVIIFGNDVKTYQNF